MIDNSFILNQLENFISNYNDQFDSFYKSECLNESSVDLVTENFNSVNSFFKNINKIFKSISINIAIFKEIKVPKQMNSDIINCLKTAYPRTLIGMDTLIIYYNYLIENKKPIDYKVSDISLDRNVGLDAYTKPTTLEFEVDKSLVDLKETIKSYESMQEVKRLKECKYHDKDLEEIPTKIIITELNSSIKYVSDLEWELEKISSFKIDKSDENLVRVTNKMIQLCKEMIRFYTIRMNLLDQYMKFARFSLNGIFKYFQKYNKANYNLSPELNMNKATEVEICITGDPNKTFYYLLIDLLRLNKEKKYKEYAESHKTVCEILKINQNSTFSIIQFRGVEDNPGSWKFHFIYYINDNSPIYVNNRPLYHHSTSEKTFSKLDPTAVGNWDRTFYPNPRVFLHLNVVLNKAGKKLDLMVDVKDPETGKVSKEYYYDIRNIYKVIDKIETVYRDPEMGVTGVYYVTEKPIKVKKINYEDWKKENNVY